jgi:uncharacterized protein (DUF1330 family)
MIVELTYWSMTWTESYRREVPALIARYGGRYITKSNIIEVFEGETPLPDLIAILEFPSIGNMRAFLQSEEYRAHRDARQSGALTRIVAVSDS